MTTLDRARAWAILREHQRAARRRWHPQRRTHLVDQALTACLVALVAAGGLIAAFLLTQDPNPVIGTVTDFDQDPGAVVYHDDPPVEPWTSTVEGAAHVTVLGDRGSWTVVMTASEAIHCHEGRPYRLHTGCDDPST